MAGISFSFDYKDDFDIVLKKVNNATKYGMQSAGEILKASVQQKALSGYGKPIYKTGNLYEHIDYEVKGGGHLQTVEVGVKKGVPYAGYVHDGTYKMPARPFVRDGVAEGQDDAIDALVDKLGDAF